MEFAYAQTTEPEMRGMVTALWFVTQGLGNLLDVVLFECFKTLTVWISFSVFTVLILGNFVVFYLMTRNYQYLATHSGDSSINKFS